MSASPIFAYAKLNARIQPMDRGDLYEDPLQQALEATGLAEVTGGGTMQMQSGEIEYCGIDLDLHDPENAVALICATLERLGAPKGSSLSYEADGRRHEVPFGRLEGLAIYFNGTDLPDHVYAECDINHVWAEIERLIEGVGRIQSYWQGPTETALYLYGDSAARMRERIAGFMAEYPLCAQARYDTVA
ncbi:MAG: hypothetical protein E6Q88_08665 [Lysobacteraceae bacterium]|nr:MAG: hypothetical protein E6Q88_08665 [Xanthomonadaceae bacterium]